MEELELMQAVRRPGPTNDATYGECLVGLPETTETVRGEFGTGRTKRVLVVVSRVRLGLVMVRECR